MTQGMPEPTPSATPDAVGGSGKETKFYPTGPPTQLSSDVGYPSASAPVNSRGTWFLRPTPRPVYQPATTNAVQQQAYDDAINYDYYQPSQLAGAYDAALTPEQQKLFTLIAKSQSSRGTGSGLFAKAVKEAERRNTGDNKVSPFDVVAEIAKKQGIMDESGNLSTSAAQALSSGGGVSGSGPSTSVSRSYMDPQSAEMLLNKLAVDKLGRNLTTDELSKYVADFRNQESKNATVTNSSGSGSSTTQAGMADADIADSIIRQNPAFADNVLKTDVLDMFYKRIGGRNG